MIGTYFKLYELLENIFVYFQARYKLASNSLYTDYLSFCMWSIRFIAKNAIETELFCVDLTHGTYIRW